MEHLDRMPGRQSEKRAVGKRMVPARDHDLRIAAMRNLDDWTVEARRVVDRSMLREARRHALCEERAVVGPWHERTPEGLHDPVRVGHRGQDLLE